MSISRRDMFKALGATGAGALLPTAPAAAQTQPQVQQRPFGPRQPDAAQPAPAPVAGSRVYAFLNQREVAFTEAALARLIPNEPEWPGALEADVSVFIDRQLGGAFGQGARFYRSGPFQSGTPGQGYQLPHTPAELYRLGVQKLYDVLPTARPGPAFHQRPPAEQDEILSAIQNVKIDLSPVPGGAFFQLLLTLTNQGYFADPVYGGNKDMTSWKMIGFPGAYAAWALAVEDHGATIDAKPVSIADHVVHGDHTHPAEGALHGRTAK